MSGRREIQQLTRVLQKQGWEIQQRRNGHLFLISPTGERTTAASTPSCRRGLLNLRATLKRMGADL